MRALMTLCVILLASFVAVAGQNPNVRLYVSFDPVEYVPSIQPEFLETYTAYVMLDCLGTETSEGGIENIYFRLDSTGGLLPLNSLIWHVPADIPITWPELDGDIFLPMTECFSDVPCPLVSASSIWVGGSGCIVINDHNELPRHVVDCNWETDYYCVISHGSVAGGECPPGDPGCECSATPVESSSWGRVKALYGR